MDNTNDPENLHDIVVPPSSLELFFLLRKGKDLCSSLFLINISVLFSLDTLSVLLFVLRNVQKNRACVRGVGWGERGCLVCSGSCSFVGAPCFFSGVG